MSIRLMGGIFLLLSCGLIACIDANVPEYDYLDGFIFVEGEVTDQPGQTQVRISESLLSFGHYIAQPQREASVMILSDTRNSADPREKVLGYFGAASTSRRRLYIDRTHTPGRGTGGYQPIFEPEPPPGAPTALSAPCREGRFRTRIKPEGWP